jgi:hypothetical protein
MRVDEGDLDSAIPMLEEAGSIAETIGWMEGVCRVDELRAGLSRKRGQTEDARSRLRRVAEAYLQMGNEIEARRISQSIADISGFSAVVATSDVQVLDAEPLYFNGINFNTGGYAVEPRSIDAMAKLIGVQPGVSTFDKTRGGRPRSFGTTDKMEDSGWGIVFPTDTPDSVRNALKPLIGMRSQRVGRRFKELDYKPGEQLRDWYARHQISPGNLNPSGVPYYLLLIGPPDQIPFEFQYLLGIDYAVGRLAFDDAADYERYARSTTAYESATSVPNNKKISYWGTRHPGDGSTKLSSSFLLEPLINGIADDDEDPINKVVGYRQEAFLAETSNSTCGTLLAQTRHPGARPSARRL